MSSNPLSPFLSHPHHNALRAVRDRTLGSVAVVVAAALFAAEPCLVRGAEGPVVNVEILRDDIIDTVTPADSTVPGFKPHIRFPWMEQRGDGSLLAWWNIGQTHGVGLTGRSSQSFDGGDTWTTPTSIFTTTPPVTLMRPSGETSRGFALNMQDDETPRTSWSDRRYVSSNGGYSWSTGTAFYNFGAVSYTTLYQQEGPIVVQGNELLFTAYGIRTVDNPISETVLFASTDNGVNWTRRSTIASHIPGPALMMGEEGPNETAFMKLDNGDLLAVFRTGQPFPNSDINATSPSLFRSISKDGGYTWSEPKMLGIVGVSPHLNRLPDGSLALTYGRYGVKMIFADPTGTRWSEPFVVRDDSTSGHVRMYENASGNWVLAYDQSSFYNPGWNNSPPPDYVYANDQMAHMRMAHLRITPQVIQEDYEWSFEYHGDVAPTQLAVPWTLTQSGSTNVRLWAELGQDFIRTDTALSGSHRSLYYTLDSATNGSAWADVDFAEGFVLDVRARAGSASTSPSSASIFLDDGVNGALSLELTGSYVGLEGLGGNASQVNYQPAGFSTLQWHDYRLIIDVDEQTELVTARLYIDGNWTQPILTQQLAATSADVIRFGDQTTGNNGILDLDYLRFASLDAQTPSADFDGDGDVDGNDFLTWQRNAGATSDALRSDGDANNDGKVDDSDLAIWSSSFGSASGDAAAVPEPTSGLLVAIGAWAAIQRRRRACRQLIDIT